MIAHAGVLAEQFPLIDDFNREDTWPSELKSLCDYLVIPSDHSRAYKDHR